MSAKKEVGKIIRTLRKQNDMTQAELAKQIGQSPSSITMYETGRRIPDLETLEALADTFNVPFTVLGHDESIAAPSAEPYVAKTKEAKILAAGIDRLPEDQRKRALAFVKMIFEQYADYFERTENDENT